MDPDRELLALGAANVAAGVSGGYAVAGSLTATAVRIEAGGRTQVASLFAALLGVLTVLFLLPALAHLPFATLAAIVVVAMAGLSDPGYLRRLWTVRRYECAVCVAAFAGVLAFDELEVGGLPRLVEPGLTRGRRGAAGPTSSCRAGSAPISSLTGELLIVM